MSSDPSRLPSLPILLPEPDEDLELEDDEPRVVLITGASGTIGRKLRAAWAERYDLILVDRQPDPEAPDLVVADLARWDDAWVELFDEADAVVHLAANPDEHASWAELVEPNMDALANVFLAAAGAGVDRLIYASSNHALSGYRDIPGVPLTPGTPPVPGNAYGGAKLFGERLGLAMARAYGITFVALRLGWVLRGQENRSESMPDAWSRTIWLSDADLVQLMTRAIEAPLDPGEAVVVNGMSANVGSRWSLAETAERLGYHPAEGDTIGPGA